MNFYKNRRKNRSTALLVCEMAALYLKPFSSYRHFNFWDPAHTNTRSDIYSKYNFRTLWNMLDTLTLKTELFFLPRSNFYHEEAKTVSIFLIYILNNKFKAQKRETWFVVWNGDVSSILHITNGAILKLHLPLFFFTFSVYSWKDMRFFSTANHRATAGSLYRSTFLKWLLIIT